jgi:FAD/FMN-containing dehydrogenase/Fe-S oxidoreductase
MDPERERIEADLRGLLSGEVRCDDVFVQLYAGDGSIFEIRPLGVVRPQSVADVAACVHYAVENDIPLHARGAGTGLAGGAVGRGLVVEFSRAMRRIVSVDEDTVRVQAGVTLAHLNRQLRAQGRIFGPDPENAHVTTIGGVLAVDASGSHWLQFGSARDWVESVQVVTSSGEVLELGREPIHLPRDSRPPALRQLVSRLGRTLASNRELIASATPRTAVNCCGYRLAGVLQDGFLDFPRLLAGSEGTLALVTEVTLRTEPEPPCRGAVLLQFERLDGAAQAALDVPDTAATACELFDGRLAAIARETDVRYDLMIPPQTGALLLVQYDGSSPVEVHDKLAHLVDLLVHKKKLAFDARVAVDPSDFDLFWQLTHRVVPTWYRLEGTTRPLPGIEDIAVPPAVLPEFLVRSQNVLKRHQVTASMFAHAGQGQLHFRPFLDLTDPQQVETMRRLAIDLYHEVIEIGGVVSGKHGDGLSRTWFVHEQYGELYDVFRQVKWTFDPTNTLNPGKIVGADDPHALTRHLRAVTPAVQLVPLEVPSGEESRLPAADAAEPPDGPRVDLPGTRPLELHCAWDIHDVAHETRSCNGCGHCRGQQPHERMCPIFRFAPAEEASPRAKANLMRAVLTGQLEPDAWALEELKAVADLCVHCHQCRSECPARVDIPRLMTECKAQYVAAKGLPLSDATMTRLDTLSSLASAFGPIYNWSISNRIVRWLLEKLLGIAQERKLPRVAARSFQRRARRQRLTRPVRGSGRKVLLFVDTYANWYDVQLADSLVAILQHNNVSVFVDPRQRASGMPLIALGALDRAKRLATHNIHVLADAVRQGYHIVAMEPAAALCITREYLNLLDDGDARRVAENTSEACAYLWKMHQAGNLALDWKPVNASVGYHQPCHLKALNVGSPGENLLRLIPGLTVKRIEQGCSGMAGTYGMKRENYRSSLRAGWGLISSLRDPGVQAGTTECSACKMQMEQGTTKPTVHPLKVLALAYGLMPELDTLLTMQGEELVVT